MILRYAKRYCYVLDDPGKAGFLHGLGKDMRRNVMASLANLSKFLGRYGYWKAIVSNAGLKWQKRSGLEAVLSILATDLQDAKEWFVKAVGALPRKYSVVIAFEALTGIRPSEACVSCGLIMSLAEENRLSEYWNIGLLYHSIYVCELRCHSNADVTFMVTSSANLANLKAPLPVASKYVLKFNKDEGSANFSQQGSPL